ncbi:jg18943 [Pararge aegeria aegeria]|uniref:Jg18943 protein n=1 Tax=Pararge aegeria aegeria TaxID=348720 RepID=A0A8S4SPR2_9NEOP|nr:jg18943 [Pararge aegeria aegeria]
MVGHIAERTVGHWGPKVMQGWNGNLAQVNAALVGQQGGQTTSNEFLGAAGNKWPGTVDFGAPNNRTMSSSGRQ